MAWSFDKARWLAIAGLAIGIGMASCKAGRGDAPLSSGEADIPLNQRRSVPCPPPEDWFKPLTEIEAMVPPIEGEGPVDCSTDLFRGEVPSSLAKRGWSATGLNWVPTELAYQPPYFDDVPLERYGQGRHPLLQPFVSGARFVAAFPLMPYKIGIDRTHDRVYTLGYYRVGSRAPWLRQRLPFEWDAALLEAGTLTGLILLLP